MRNQCSREKFPAAPEKDFEFYVRRRRSSKNSHMLHTFFFRQFGFIKFSILPISIHTISSLSFWKAVEWIFQVCFFWTSSFYLFICLLKDSAVDSYFQRTINIEIKEKNILASKKMIKKLLLCCMRIFRYFLLVYSFCMKCDNCGVRKVCGWSFFYYCKSPKYIFCVFRMENIEHV